MGVIRQIGLLDRQDFEEKLLLPEVFIFKYLPTIQYFKRKSTRNKIYAHGILFQK